MSSTNILASFGDDGDTEMSSSVEQQTSVPEDPLHIEIPSQPLDLRVFTKRDSEERAPLSPSFQRQIFSFLNAPLLKEIHKCPKNVSIPVAEIKPFSSCTSKPEDLSNTNSLQMSKPPASSAIDEPTASVAADTISQESKSKAALKFCLRKCGEFSLYFRSSSSKVVAPTNSRFQSLLTSLKNTVKSLARAMPSSIISRIHSSVLNKIKEKRMQDCLKFSLSFTPFSKRKKMLALAAQQQPNESTFVSPTKKPELQHLAGFQFAKPKIYECSYCDTRFYKLPIYIKHIRRHAEIIRCDTCWKSFSSVINKRRHQLQCRQRSMP